MKIYLAGDHAGFYLKEEVKKYLAKKGHEVNDLGPFLYDKNDDYPDYSFPLAEKVAADKNSSGIIIAGSGIGECIVANKIKGIRAVLYHGKSKKILITSKEHDDCNVLCFGARFVSEKDAKQSIDLWLKTKFSSAERHTRRLNKIKRYEMKN